MRTIPAGLLAELQGDSPRIAWGVLVERADGTQLRLTSADQDATISGVPVNGSATGALAYLSAPGLDVSNIRSTEGFAVDNLEGTLLEGGVVTKPDVLRGLWDEAAWTLFRYCWADVALGIDVVKTGLLGNLQPRTGHFKVELRDLRQALQPDRTVIFSPDCRHELGDTRCGVNLATWTHNGTVTAVTSAQVFTDSGRAEASEYFDNGKLTWLTGDNAGITVKVKTFAADVFTLTQAMLSSIQVGDTYSAIAGCRKRKTEDCATKFSNVLNHGGWPDKPLVTETISG